MQVRIQAIALLIVCLLLALSCGSESTIETDPRLETVLNYERLANLHQVDSLLPLYADNAYLNVAPLATFAGQQDIRELHHFDRALNTSRHFSDVRSATDSVYARVWELNDWLKLAGIDSIEYSDCRFGFDQAGLISGVEIKLSPESEATLLPLLDRFDSWARQNRAEYYAPLFDANGQYPVDHRGGRMALVLLYEMQK